MRVERSAFVQLRASPDTPAIGTVLNKHQEAGTCLLPRNDGGGGGGGGGEALAAAEAQFELCKNSAIREVTKTSGTLAPEPISGDMGRRGGEGGQ